MENLELSGNFKSVISRPWQVMDILMVNIIVSIYAQFQSIYFCPDIYSL